MELTYLLKFLLRKKWVIIIPTIFAIILAFLFTRHEQHSYTSFAELSTGYITSSPLDNNRNGNNVILFNNVIQTLKSNRILDLVTYNLILNDLSNKSNFHRSVDKTNLDNLLKKFPGGKVEVETTLRHMIDSFYVLALAKERDKNILKIADLYGYAPGAISANIEIEQIRGSDFIRIRATTENPSLSAFIANSICAQFLSFYQSMQGQASTTSLETLKNIVETKKEILDNKLKLLQGGNDLATSNSIGLLGNLQAQLAGQKNNLIAAKVALESINKQINGKDQAAGLANNEEIIAIRNNIDNLWAKYVNSGSNDANLLTQINNLRNDYQQKLSAIGNQSDGSSLSSLRSKKNDLEIKEAVAQETMQDLQNKINTLQGSVQSNASQEGLLQGVQNEVEIARQEYASANNLYNQTVTRNIFPGNNFKQTLLANPSLYPNPSKKVMIIGFAGSGVFFIIIFILIFLEFIDRSIKTSAYLQENTDIPLLGNLQLIRINKYPINQIFSANGSLPIPEKGFRDQVKNLRYEIENSEKKIFLITGFHTHSGKSTTIQSLAESLSLSKKKTLLIDSNFQNNTLTRIFQATPSLESIKLTGDRDKDIKEIEKSISDTEDSNIKIIGCSVGSYTPEEILPKNNLFTYLREIDNGFDYVFVDCAALSKGPDSKELLKYVDTVIVVFSADQSLTEEDNKLINTLRESKANILGTILTRVSPENINI